MKKRPPRRSLMQPLRMSINLTKTLSSLAKNALDLEHARYLLDLANWAASNPQGGNCPRCLGTGGPEEESGQCCALCKGHRQLEIRLNDYSEQALSELSTQFKKHCLGL